MVSDFLTFAVSEIEFKEKLIANVKKEVKQIMEESVTRKFVHEDSSTVVLLCAAVEACLSQGLRRRALGLFKTSSTTALLHKISSVSLQMEKQMENTFSSIFPFFLELYGGSLC